MDSTLWRSQYMELLKDYITDYYKELDSKIVAFYGTFEAAKEAALAGRIIRRKIRAHELIYCDGILVSELCLELGEQL